MPDARPAAPQPPRLPPELDEFFARNEPTGSASARERHAWTRREVAVALRLEEFPTVTTVADLFTTETLALLWELGAADRLRTRTARRRRQDPQSVNTQLARWSSLNRLLAASGCAAQLPPRPQPLPRAVPLPADEPVRLADELTPRAARRGSRSRDLKTVRLLAVVGLILDTGAWTAEVHALRWSDLADDLSTVTLVRRPPGGNAEEPPLRQVFAVSERTQAALRDWRVERDLLASGIQGSDEGKLWVTLSSSLSGPPGRSLALGGLARTYNTVIGRLELWSGMSLPPHLKDLSLARAQHVVPLSSEPVPVNP